MTEKKFPEGMIPVGDGKFLFACHAGLSCFTHCCRNIRIALYPYDVVRLKQHLQISSDKFLDKYTHITVENGFLPAVTLRMSDNDEKTCPFLGKKGCKIYRNRPTDCRMYPLERAVDRSLPECHSRDFYFVHRADFCLGHGENQEWTVEEWIRDQDIELFNRHNDLWVEIDTLLRTSSVGPGMISEQERKMAFMACYNLDAFRRFIFESTFLKRFNLPAKLVKKLRSDDISLLKFGVDWLRFFLRNDKVLGFKTMERTI